jgi:hypothetical protein
MADYFEKNILPVWKKVVSLHPLSEKESIK